MKNSILLSAALILLSTTAYSLEVAVSQKTGAGVGLDPRVPPLNEDVQQLAQLVDQLVDRIDELENKLENMPESTTVVAGGGSSEGEEVASEGSEGGETCEVVITSVIGGKSGVVEAYDCEGNTYEIIGGTSGVVTIKGPDGNTRPTGAVTVKDVLKAV